MPIKTINQKPRPPRQSRKYMQNKDIKNIKKIINMQSDKRLKMIKTINKMKKIKLSRTYIYVHSNTSRKIRNSQLMVLSMVGRVCVSNDEPFRFQRATKNKHTDDASQPTMKWKVEFMNKNKIKNGKNICDTLLQQMGI